jgi:hypothetical protein
MHFVSCVREIFRQCKVVYGLCVLQSNHIYYAFIVPDLYFGFHSVFFFFGAQLITFCKVLFNLTIILIHILSH